MRLLLAVVVLLSAWLIYVSGDENSDEMEKKAAVDCKTIKKTNTRTMNFTEKGKEYVCKQLIEKEHKLFTFFKIPNGEDDAPVANQIVAKNFPDMKGNGKRCFVVCMDPNLDDDVQSKNVLASNNGTARRIAPEKLEAFEVQTNYTQKLMDKYFKKNRGDMGTMLTRKNVRGRITTDKFLAPFKLSIPGWLKIPSSDVLASQRTPSEMEDLQSFTEFPPPKSRVHLERRIIRKHRPNKKNLTKTSETNVTTPVQTFPMKYIGTIPTKIEQTTSALVDNVLQSSFTEGALNKISMSYEEIETESIQHAYPDMDGLQTSAVKGDDRDFEVSNATTPAYSDSLSDLSLITQLIQTKNENL